MYERPVLTAALVGDVHLDAASEVFAEKVVAKMAERAEVLLFVGDMIHTGRQSEAAAFGRIVHDTGKPAFTVLGNHEMMGEKDAVVKTYEECGITILQTERAVLPKERPALGVIGLTGGYDGTLAETVTPKRERLIERGKQRLTPQLQTLEELLTTLPNLPHVILTHYATTVATIIGEVEAQYELHGSRKVNELADQKSEQIVGIFHGHTHLGALRGKTAQGIPVFNVALPVLGRTLGLTKEEVAVDPPVCLVTFSQGPIDIFVGR